MLTVMVELLKEQSRNVDSHGGAAEGAKLKC